jgi:hypothetical membrane protein
MTMERTSRALTAAAAMWIASATVYVGGEAIAASAFPGYSYATNYISDLGIPTVGQYDGRAIDSPLAGVMNAGFIAHGVLFFAGAALAALAAGPGFRVARSVFLAAAGAHLVGSVLIGVVPGSSESVATGAIGLHVLGAGLAIVGGNLASATAGIAGNRFGFAPGYRVFSVVVGAAGILSVIALQLDLGGLPDGIWERASVYAITVWELVTAAALLRRRRGWTT